MRYKTLKIVIVTALLFLASFLAGLAPAGADPYTDKLESRNAAVGIIHAILQRDVDLLTALSHMPTSFHFGERDRAEEFLKNYFNVIIETKKIEIEDVNVKNDHEAEITVSVHLFNYRSEGIKGTDIKPKEETWTFIKAVGSSFSKDQRGKWLFVME